MSAVEQTLAAPVATKPRERYIDVWRAAAVIRIVVYHGSGLAWLTLLFPAMGLMFALAGSLTARSLDRSPSHVVRGRLRRLLPPLWAYGAIMLPLTFSGGEGDGWGPFLDEPRERIDLLWWIVPVEWPPPGGAEWGWMATAVLWYLVAYLWFVVLAPVTLRIFRGWPVPTLLVALAAPLILHLELITVGGSFESLTRDLATYFACWIVGYAHRDRLLHRIPGPVFAAAVLLLAGAAAVWLFRHGGARGDFDLNHHPVASAWWSTAFVAAVLRFDQPLRWLRPGSRLDRAVAAVNARAVTIYLWHFPMLGVAQFLLDGVNLGDWTRRALTTGIVAAATCVPVLLLGWVEDLAARRTPSLLPPVLRRPAVAPQAPPVAAVGTPDHWARRTLAGFGVSAVAVVVVAAGWTGDSTGGTSGSERQPVHEQEDFVSDLPYTALRNGLGPVERDHTNGTAEPDDGAPIVLADVPYARGLGVSSPSAVRLYPRPGCLRFTAVVGLDQESAGSATFLIAADDTTVATLGPLEAGQASEVTVDIIGVTRLDLIVEDQHGPVNAVWADARLVCSQ
ncbi:acyltransferase family protein [Dactylosporangium sp. NPDC005555]|uniref:acyltransferase family protein n=1 Tax=Dactylosporangium sp. NPDC005555 TaxID=3154889 RepID=UPI0033A0D951